MNERVEGFDTDVEKRPPIIVMLAACLVVAATFVLLRWPDFTVHVIGYMLGSVVCAALAAAFVRIDAARRTAGNVVYLEFRAARYVWSGILSAGIAGCSIHAWHIADHLAVIG